MTWPDEWMDPVEQKREIAAAVDWFKEALTSKDDVAQDLVDPRLPLLPPVADWCKAVDNASWNNRDWALGLWHVALGQTLRDQRIVIGDRWLDGRFHLLILAESSSGKTLAADQARHLLERSPRDPPYDVRPILEATTAALIGSSEIRKVKGASVMEKVPGMLESADLLHWDEAEAMFTETGYNVNLLRVLNQTMNPIGSPGNVIGKELKGVSVKVRPKCSLLMTAVDFLEIPEEIFRCGFYQRIGVMRKVLSIEQRLKNARREKEVIDKGTTAIEQLGRAIEYVERMRQTYAYPVKWDLHRITGYVYGKFTQMIKAAQKNEQVRPYLVDFAERYKDKLFILSVHNCAMRTIDEPLDPTKPRIVEPEDAGRAWIVVKTCMEQFFYYATEISYNWEHLHRKNIRHRTLGPTP